MCGRQFSKTCLVISDKPFIFDETSGKPLGYSVSSSLNLPGSMSAFHSRWIFSDVRPCIGGSGEVAFHAMLLYSCSPCSWGTCRAGICGLLLRWKSSHFSFFSLSRMIDNEF